MFGAYANKGFLISGMAKYYLSNCVGLKNSSKIIALASLEAKVNIFRRDPSYESR